MSDAHLIARGTSLGRYIVVRHLGTGGQGVVYAAYDPELDRSVALKLLRPDVGAGSPDDRRTRLMREAQEHARLQHPNVVQILHVGQFIDQLYLAMPFMGGGTLEEWLLEKKHPRAEVLARFVEAGRGLAAAHAQGLVHRDFKPDNVMLDERGVAHVADFGLAQRGAAAGGAGTTRYLSPEQQARTESVGPASDQFSFCVALCEALSGQLPSLEGAVVKLPAGTALPPWLRVILQRGLSPKPSDRYPSMEALLAVLEVGEEARRRLISRVSLALLVSVSVLAIGRLVTRETAGERAQRECVARVRETEERVWGAERVTRMEQRFTSVAGPVGAETFSRVKSLMSPEVKAWAEATGEACVHPVSAPLARCLESRSRVLQSLSELFLAAETDVVASSLNAVRREVLPVAGCLTTSVASPRVVPDSEVDQKLRPTLSRARVLRAAGKYPEAILASMAVVEQAHDQGAVRVEAEAQLLVGQLSNYLHRADTEAVLMRAVMLAEQASADEERAKAWMVLITWYASHDDLEAAALARDQADAILERLGRPDHLEADQQSQVGVFLMIQRDKPEAVRAFKRALELRRKHYDESHPLVSSALTSLALALPSDEAAPLLQSVLDTKAASFGEQHPETAAAAHNLGGVLQELDGRKALVPLQRARDIWQGQTPPDLCRLARAHFALSRAYESIDPPGTELGSALEEQSIGLNFILQTDCSEAISSEEELTWLLDLKKRLKRPSAEVSRIEELLALVKKKEALPTSLTP